VRGPATLLLALLVIAVAAGAVWGMLALGCDAAPDFVLIRGACDRGVQESALAISAGVTVVVGGAFMLDRRRRRRRG
jgi:hypothetical protein